MSDLDQADEDKGFLARWLQRKHAAKQPDRDAPTANPDTPSGPVAEGNAEREFDLSSLPKLEDMTATTDITAFLRKGVPEHLRNAALRKSWALDPAIRNYVNPALEYAYDWNTWGRAREQRNRSRHGCRAAGFADHGQRRIGGRTSGTGRRPRKWVSKRCCAIPRT